MGTVYFILPIYNEADGLDQLIHALRTLELPAGLERRIVAIDDGSTDGTHDILMAERNRDLYLITHPSNKGIPGVFKSAFAYLGTVLTDDDAVVVMEADQTSDLACVPLFFAKIRSGSDLVIASRHVVGGAYVRFPWYRTLGSSIMNAILRILWRIPGVTDYTIFYRAYKGSLLRQFWQKNDSFYSQKSFAVNGELLLRLSTLHPRIAEVPLRYDYGLKKGLSKMKLFATLAEYVHITRLHQSSTNKVA